MLTDDTLRDAYLLPHSWENDARLVVMARDMDPMSPRRGELLYAGTRETFASLDPVLSNIPQATTFGKPATWVEGRGWISEPAPYTFDRGGLVGWYVDDITAGFNRGQIDALKAATDFEQAWAQFLGVPDEQPKPITIDPPYGIDPGTTQAITFEHITVPQRSVAQLNLPDSPADESERLLARSQAEKVDENQASVVGFPSHLVACKVGDIVLADREDGIAEGEVLGVSAGGNFRVGRWMDREQRILGPHWWVRPWGIIEVLVAAPA